MIKDDSLRLEKLSLLLGQIIGQQSELLNQIYNNNLSVEKIYNSLKDITQLAALHLHEIYYKEQK